MAIGNRGRDVLKINEIKSRDFQLGMSRVKVLSITDHEDSYGTFLNFVFFQNATGKVTLSVDALKDVSYADDPRGYYEIAHSIVRVYINDRFYEDVINGIASTMPSFASACEAVGWADALNALEGNEMTVWFSRTKKGNLQVHFSEANYRYWLKRGNVGGDVDVPFDDKVLNDEAPF